MNQEIGIHQCLMDTSYDLWNNQKWSYREFLMNLDPLHRSAVVLGNLNYQVCNGGFSQWMFNGYTDGNEFLFHALKSMNTQTSTRVMNLVSQALQLDCDNDDFDHLDSEYYELESTFMKECNEFFQNRMNTHI
jgi:hypothetical protein